MLNSMVTVIARFDQSMSANIAIISAPSKATAPKSAMRNQRAWRSIRFRMPVTVLLGLGRAMGAATAGVMRTLGLVSVRPGERVPDEPRDANRLEPDEDPDRNRHRVVELRFVLGGKVWHLPTRGAEVRFRSVSR